MSMTDYMQMFGPEAVERQAAVSRQIELQSGISSALRPLAKVGSTGGALAEALQKAAADPEQANLAAIFKNFLGVESLDAEGTKAQAGFQKVTEMYKSLTEKSGERRIAMEKGDKKRMAVLDAEIVKDTEALAAQVEEFRKSSTIVELEDKRTKEEVEKEMAESLKTDKPKSTADAVTVNFPESMNLKFAGTLRVIGRNADGSENGETEGNANPAPNV
jgi:hypothetical protein